MSVNKCSKNDLFENDFFSFWLGHTEEVGVGGREWVEKKIEKEKEMKNVRNKKGKSK